MGTLKVVVIVTFFIREDEGVSFRSFESSTFCYS